MLKMIKYNKFCDTYQMQRCYGGYTGVDRCDIFDTGRFVRGNVLSELNAALDEKHDLCSNLCYLSTVKLIRWLR